MDWVNHVGSDILSVMSLNERLTQDLTSAMKARDAARVSVLRMAKSALKNREIDNKGPLDSAVETRLLKTLVKQREESAQTYREAQRPDLADKELAEAAMLRAYLPAAASAEEITAAVQYVIAESGADSMKDMGGVMKAALGQLAASGKVVDGKRVSETVRSQLTARQDR